MRGLIEVRGYRYIKLPPLNVRTKKTMESDISFRTSSLRITICSSSSIREDC